MLFNKPLAAIEEHDLQTLIDNQVSERRNIEYKSILPSNSDGDKKEFLADVSSFANTSGGDLVYGMNEQAGIPVSFNGLQIDDVDAEILRLDSSIRTGIAPRLPKVEIHAVPLSSEPQHYAIIIRIQKSFLSPHMVTLKNDSKFFARNSRGKYQLDVSELRTAFVLSATLAEEVRSFRVERLSRINSGEETPVLLDEKEAKIVLHLVPLDAFSSSLSLDLKPLNNASQGELLRPLSVWDQEPFIEMRFNIDGLVRSNRSEYKSPRTLGYTQVFRNGVIETADMTLLGINALNAATLGSNVNPMSFSGMVYERKILEAIKRYIDLQKFLGIEPPFFIMVSLLGIRDYKISFQLSEHGFSDYTDPIDRNNLFIPEVLVENLDGVLAEAMRPIFDTVWNAAGYYASPNYDNEGKFKFGY